jgi:hypothetical protein
MFRLEGKVWEQRGGKISQSNLVEFGTSASLSFDGAIALIGTHSGKAFFYRLNERNHEWQEDQALAQGKQQAAFGYSVALNSAGNVAAIGAPREGDENGAVYLYERKQGGAFKLKQTLDAGLHSTTRLKVSSYGIAVAISADSSTLLISARTTELFFVDEVTEVHSQLVAFAYSSGPASLEFVPLPEARLVPTGMLGEQAGGFSLALSADGAVAVLGAVSDDEYTGGAWVFARIGDEYESAMRPSEY